MPYLLLRADASGTVPDAVSESLLTQRTSVSFLHFRAALCNTKQEEVFVLFCFLLLYLPEANNVLTPG